MDDKEEGIGWSIKTLQISDYRFQTGTLFMKYSDFESGDSLAGMCVMGDKSQKAGCHRLPITCLPLHQPFPGYSSKSSNEQTFPEKIKEKSRRLVSGPIKGLTRFQVGGLKS